MSAQPEPAAAVLKSLRRLLIALCLIAVGLLTFYAWSSYEGRKAIVKSARAACEAEKLDRIDNAAGWTAHSLYITNVTSAASVKEDVKAAARQANMTYREVSESLTMRARIQCEREVPSASLVP